LSKDPNINTLASGFRSSNKLNENLEAIQAAFLNTLSRDGSGPNEMLAPLDMNSQRILNLPAPVELTDPVRLIDLADFSPSIDETVVAAIAEAAALDALDTKVDVGFDSIANSLSVVGDFELRSLGTEAVPADGVYIGTGGPNLSFNTLISDPAWPESDGDDQRAQVLIVTNTKDDGNTEEQALCLLTTIDTGFQKTWAPSTPFYTGDNVMFSDRNTVYRCITPGVSAASGIGPEGRGQTITDGTCVWRWINDAAIQAKLGVYNEVVVKPGAGSVWAHVNNLDLQEDYAGTFAVNTELDLTNNSGVDSGFNGINKLGLWVAAQGANTSTALIQASSANTANWAALWGSYYAGTKLAKNAVIEIDASSDGYGIAHGAGGVVVPTYTLAAYKDISTSPFALSLAGQNNIATINIENASFPDFVPLSVYATGFKFKNATTGTAYVVTAGGTAGASAPTTLTSGIDIANGTMTVRVADNPAAIQVSGNRSVASYYDSTTAPNGIVLAGTNSGSGLLVSGTSTSAAISATGNGGPALSSSGTRTTAAINDVSTVPVGVRMAGTYSTAAFSTGATCPTAFNSGGTNSSAAFASSGNAPAGLSIGGTKSLGSIVDGAAAPYGIILQGTYSASPMRFTTLPPEYADDAAAATGGLLVGAMYRTGSTLKVRVA
jgi:hypothetical protein